MKEITKKFLSVGLASAMVASFAGCQANTSKDDSQTPSLSAEEQYQQDVSSRYTLLNYSYDAYIKDSILIKYKDQSGKPSAIVVNLSTSRFSLLSDRVTNIYKMGKIFEDIYSRTEDNRDVYKSNEDIEIKALDEFIGTLGELISKEQFSKYMVSEYGAKNSYSAVEIDKVITSINEKLEQDYIKKQQEIENQIKLEEEKKKSRVTIDELLNDYQSKSDVFYFTFQDQLYSEELAQKNPEEMYSKAISVKEITYEDGKKYLVDADETKILLGGYDMLGDPIEVFSVYQDKKSHPYSNGMWNIVEVVIDGKKYIIDASDLRHILAADIKNYKYDDRVLSFTYKDGTTETYDCFNLLYQDDNKLLTLDASNCIIKR